MAIRMIGLDLDGTTLDNKGRFSTRTKEAFHNARNKGTHIVVATGRTLCSLPSELFEIDGLEYVITSNGARIIETKNCDTIYENFISGEATREIHDLLKPSGANIEIFFDGRAYIGLPEYEMIRNGGPSKRDRDYVISTRKPVDDIYEMLLKEAGRIENISINYIYEEEKKQIEGMLEGIKNVTVTSSFPHNNEVGGKTTSKATALKHMMEVLSIGREELMCCGDSLNDIEMIKLAEIGVAMQNAVQEVKEKANYITDFNYEDGVAKAIERFVLL